MRILTRWKGRDSDLINVHPIPVGDGAIHEVASQQEEDREESSFAFTSGRIRNISSDFGAFLAISQNTVKLVSHVLENLMKKLELSPFDEIEKF